ncbi:MAG: NAD(P)-binding protein, partial [Bacteroidota bacterium]
MSNSVLIIGSGLGGLLTGYLLSKEGLQVTILEKHRKFGGCLQTFTRDRYTFDTGMHYIGSMAPGQTLYNYWKYFGLSDNLDLLPMDPDGFDVISFPESEFPLAQGFDNFRKRLLPYFPGAESVLEAYVSKLDEIARSHPLYNLEIPSKRDQKLFFSIKAYDFLDNLFSGIGLAEILAGNNFLYAGNPSTTPLSQFGLINHSFISSAWRLAGGSQQIADILVEGIRAHSGQVLAKKRVISIGRTGERFSIVTADGDRFEAGQVVSDIHPAATLQFLIGIPIQKAFRERITHLENTVSVFSVYLGLKPDTVQFLNHNVYHHASSNVWTDYGSAIRDPRSQLPSFLGEGPGEGYIPDSGWPREFLFMTPPEKDQGAYARTALIMTPMRFQEVSAWEKSDSGAREKSYFVFKAKKAKRLLDAVYEKFPNLKEAVATIDISTPLTWRDYTGTPQ